MCPPGYFLKNCSTKCRFPNYGEQCQSVCQCPIVSCHFATGCHQHVLTYTDSTKGEIAQQKTFSLTVTVSYRTKGYSVSADISDNEATQMTHLSTEIDLFKKDFLVHVVQIVLSFIGIFVIVFTIFVIAYIYLKCFRKKANESEFDKHQTEAQYTSLRFSAVGPESRTQPRSREQDNTDCTYLTPVFRDRANSDICQLDENADIVQETSFKRHQNRDEPADESNSTPDAGLANVYIEIAQDNTENSILVGAFHGDI